MLNRKYLFLQTICLKAAESWSHDGEDLCFLFLKRGVGTLFSGGLEQPLLPGDVLVVNGYFRARPSVTAWQEMTILSFAVSFEHLFPLFASVEVSLLQNITEALQGFRYHSAFSPLAQECHRLLEAVPPQFDLDHRSQLLRVVAAILTPEFRNTRQQQRRFQGSEDYPFGNFEELAEGDILSLSVTDLARRFNCSRRHLNRLFHQHFGLSVGTLRMEMRLSKAASLLRNPGATITAVAEQCGFNHLSFFNACFKRRFGASPGEWRKSRPVGNPTVTAAPHSDPNGRLPELSRIPWLQRMPAGDGTAPSPLPVHTLPETNGSNGRKTRRTPLERMAPTAASPKRNGKHRKPALPLNPAVIPPHDEQPSKP